MVFTYKERCPHLEQVRQHLRIFFISVSVRVNNILKQNPFADLKFSFVICNNRAILSCYSKITAILYGYKNYQVKTGKIIKKKYYIVYIIFLIIHRK